MFFPLLSLSREINDLLLCVGNALWDSEKFLASLSSSRPPFRVSIVEKSRYFPFPPFPLFLYPNFRGPSGGEPAGKSRRRNCRELLSLPAHSMQESRFFFVLAKVTRFAKKGEQVRNKKNLYSFCFLLWIACQRGVIVPFFLSFPPLPPSLLLLSLSLSETAAISQVTSFLSLPRFSSFFCLTAKKRQSSFGVVSTGNRGMSCALT